jgi:hypothetical protein
MAKKNKHHLPAITRVVIQGGQLIPNVAASRCRPDEQLALAIVNNDAVDYQLRMTTFKNKGANTALTQANLFKVSAPSHAIAMNTVTVVERTVRAAANWGTNAGQFPYTTYEFTLELWDSAGTTMLDDLDPDFDITP